MFQFWTLAKRKQTWRDFYRNRAKLVHVTPFSLTMLPMSLFIMNLPVAKVNPTSLSTHWYSNINPFFLAVATMVSILTNAHVSPPPPVMDWPDLVGYDLSSPPKPCSALFSLRFSEALDVFYAGFISLAQFFLSLELLSTVQWKWKERQQLKFLKQARKYKRCVLHRFLGILKNIYLAYPIIGAAFKLIENKNHANKNKRN